MQHIDTDTRPTTLASLPAVWSYWLPLSLDEMFNLLRDTLIMKSGMVELPEHENMQLLLISVYRRLQYLRTKEMMQKCEAFAVSLGVLSQAAEEGEKFLQIKAVVCLYLGRFDEAAQLAGLLGNKYYLLHRCAYDRLSGHFNKIAGIAYQYLDDPVQASHHYNKYIFTSLSYDFIPQELVDILSYLLDLKTLIVTQDTAVQFGSLPERCQNPYAAILTTLLNDVSKKQMVPAKDYFSFCMPKSMRALDATMLAMFKPRKQRQEVKQVKPKIKIFSTSERNYLLPENSEQRNADTKNTEGRGDVGYRPK